MYANDNGLAGGNESGLIVDEAEANLVYRNLAQTNYAEEDGLGNGFYIEGSNVILKRNIASNNEGDGFVYDYEADIFFPHDKGAVLFERNMAFFNLENGISADTDWSEDFGTNGAIFKGNRAFDNGMLDPYDFYDLYDENDACSASYYNLDTLNAWRGNRGRSANVPCVKNGWL
jgi:hypothetical protein